MVQVKALNPFLQIGNLIVVSVRRSGRASRSTLNAKGQNKVSRKKNEVYCMTVNCLELL